MTDFCDFVPDDPSCQNTDGGDSGLPENPDVPDTGADGESDMSMSDMDMEDMTTMQKAMMPGNLAFLGMAIEHGVMAGLTLFRYRSASTYYDDGDTIFTTANWWKLANLI